MDIKQDKRNLLFKRNEIIFDIVSEKNPSFDEMKKLVAEKLSKPEENIDIKNIKGKFGRDNFEVKIFIYDSKEDLDSIKKLELTGKQRDEIKKAAAEAKKNSGANKSEAEKDSSENKVSDTKVEG